MHDLQVAGIRREAKEGGVQTIGIIGGGAWGTALATVAVRAGRRCILWARESEVVDAINATRENTVFLPGVPLGQGIGATAELADLAEADAVLMVCPAQFMRPVSERLARHLPTDRPLIICAKGIERTTGYLMADVLGETMGANPVAVLSGPTFAAEVAQGLPAAVTIACESDVIGEAIIEALGVATFRPYWTDDVIGAQVGGAVKNVLAIACGIVAGRGLGENARAAVITRGMAEIMRFGLAKGARRETLMGLSGLGDMILTCSSLQSRNMSLGKALGEGDRLNDILDRRSSVAEGVFSAEVVWRIAQRAGLDLPIISAIYKILYEGAEVGETVSGLLSRPFTREED